MRAFLILLPLAGALFGVAMLRRDGFAAFVTDGRGVVTTRPVVFSGTRLFVNRRTGVSWSER